MTANQISIEECMAWLDRELECSDYETDTLKDIRSHLLRAQWQPIETAPKDGTPILGFDNEDMAVVKWCHGCWGLIVSGSYAEDNEWWPIHWTHLPAPPKPEEK